MQHDCAAYRKRPRGAGIARAREVQIQRHCGGCAIVRAGCPGEALVRDAVGRKRRTDRRHDVGLVAGQHAIGRGAANRADGAVQRVAIGKAGRGGREVDRGALERDGASRQGVELDTAVGRGALVVQRQRDVGELDRRAVRAVAVAGFDGRDAGAERGAPENEVAVVLNHRAGAGVKHLVCATATEAGDPAHAVADTVGVHDLHMRADRRDCVVGHHCDVEQVVA